MENWQIEIKRLDKIRLELGLNWNKLEKITNIDRGQLKRFFEFTNVPSMKFYFDVKVALENEFEVKFGDVEVHRNGGVAIGKVPPATSTRNSNDVHPTRGVSFIETAKDKVALKVRKFVNGTCDCKLENGLLKRGKIKCTLSKVEHKF